MKFVFNSLFSKIAIVSSLLITAFSAMMWGAENDTHNMERSQSTVLNNNASIPSINIEAQTYSVKAVTVNWRYNKSTADVVTIEVTVGGNSWGTKTVGTNTTADAVFEGDATIGEVVISFTNHAGSGTGKGTFYINSVTFTEGGDVSPTQPLTISITPNYAFWGKDAQFSGNTYDNLSGSKNNVSLAWTRGTGSTYANTSSMRFYKDNTLTFTAPTGYLIKSIVLSGSVQSDTNFSPDGFNSETSTWTGSSTTVTMSRPSSGSSYSSISTIAISLSLPSSVVMPVFSPAAGTYKSAQNVEISTETDGATIYYTIDGSLPSKSSDVYSSAINVSSNTTIKAFAAKGDEESGIALAAYNILNIHDGTQADPYTVDDAYVAIDAGLFITGVYATGIVSEIVTEYDSEYGNISYNISTDGTTSSAQLQAYRGKSFNGENFTSSDDIRVGDVVVVYGNLTKFSTTYEFAQNNQLVSRQRPATIIADNVTIEYDATSGEIAYSITNPTGQELTASSDSDWISNITVSATKVSFASTINNGNTDRIATITLSYSGAADRAIAVTQKHFIADYAILPFAYDGNGLGELPEGLSQSELNDKYNSSPKIKFDDTGKYLVLKINEAPGTLSFDIKGNSFSGGTFKVQTSSNGVDYIDLATYTELESSTQTMKFINLSSDIRYIKWVYTNKKSGNVALGNIKLAQASPSTIELTGTLSNGRYWASFYNGVDRYSLSDGAQAFTMDTAHKLYLLGEDGTVIPEDTAVIIISDYSNITLTKSGSSTTITINGSGGDHTNILNGSDTSISVAGLSGTPYVLGVVGGVLGFYTYTGTNIPAGKAYYEE